jgi:hypothetical protein
MRKTSNTLILVAAPYFIEKIHISVWDREIFSQPILSFHFRVKVFTSSAFICAFPVIEQKRKSGSIIFFMLGKLIFNHLKVLFLVGTNDSVSFFRN